MATPSPVRLLIADRSENRAHEIDSVLRNAAIAYVHEGMHIYANDDYFKLFGFEDAEELLGLPLLDLMDASFTNDFRAKIKSFREDSSDELSFAFRGRSTSGEPIAGQMTLS